MNKYELALVLNAKVEDEVRLAALEKAKGYITRYDGVITDESHMHIMDNVLRYLIVNTTDEPVIEKPEAGQDEEAAAEEPAEEKAPVE